MVSEVRVLTTYQEGVDPDGTVLESITGTVTLSGSADIRGSASVTVDGTEDAWPLDNDDLLTPYGNELFIRRGIDFGNGTVEWVSLGYFRIDDVTQKGYNYPITLTCFDRMVGIIEARLLTPVQFVVGTLVGDIVSTLVLEVYPNATIEWDDDTDGESITRAQIAEEDRFGFLSDLITSYGKIMYFDYRGILVIEDVPQDDTPVFNVNSGAGGVLIDINRSRTREGVYNAVVVNGEGADTTQPIFAIVTDNDPTSPTNYNGRFGKVPRFYVSTFITTNDQALRTAQSLLIQTIGLPYSVNFDTIVNPALEPYDPIGLITGANRELHILDTIEVPLEARRPMTANTRVRERTPL
jgi:hypothetical protein